MLIHTEEKLHECTDCGKKFIRWDSLIKHIIIEFIEKGPLMRCEWMEVYRKSSLKQHMPEHMMIHKGEKPHECTECGWKFCFACKMKLHIRERSHRNVLYVGRNLIRQPIWSNTRWYTQKWSLISVQNVGSRLDSLKRHIWYTQERNLINVMNLGTDLRCQAIWTNVWWHIQERSFMNALMWAEIHGG